MSDLPATLVQLQEMLRRGDLSPSQALQRQRQRLVREQASTGCAVQVFMEHGEDEAPYSSHTPLRGIGLAHKDIFDLDGWRPGLGHDRGRPAAESVAAEVIVRLARAGASQLGTLAMAEYACGATGHNPRLGPLRNPLGHELAVGGSSSGSAVAVAGELVYGSLGTDTAGSVRIPAATCGVLGLKTTHGLLPVTGVHPLAPSLDGVGLLTRSATDAQALLLAMADSDDLRPATHQPRVTTWLPHGRLSAVVGDALEALAHEWAADARPAHWPEQAHWAALSEIVLYREAAGTHQAALRAGRMSPSVEAIAMPGLAVPDAWYQAAIRERNRQAAAFFEAALRTHDVLMLPALLEPVPEWESVTPGTDAFDSRQLVALYSCMGFINYLGFPSLVFPIAADAQGRPISVQLVGRPYEEQTLLALAARIEQDRFGQDGFTRRFNPIHH